MKYKLINFSEGGKLLYKRAKRGNATSAYVGFFAGSDYEKNGLPHFVEHMLFNGTKNRTREQIKEDRTSICGMNAATGNDYLIAHFTQSNKNINACFEFMSDLLLNSTFPSADIDGEASVVLEEKQMKINKEKYSSTVNNYLFIFKDDESILDRNEKVFGKEEFLKNLKSEDFLAFRDKHFTKNKFIASICSSLPLFKIKKLINKYFLSKLKSNDEEVMPYHWSHVAADEDVFVVNSPKEEVYKCYLTIVDPNSEETKNSYFDKNDKFLDNYLNHKANFFYNQNRVDGLVYSQSYFISDVYGSHDASAFIYSFLTSKLENIEKIISNVGNTIKFIKEHGISEDDRKTILQRILMQMDIPKQSATMNECAHEMLRMYSEYREKNPYNRHISERQYRKFVKEPTAKSMEKRFNQIFDSENKVFLTIVGNCKKEDFKPIEFYKGLLFK